MKGIIFNLLERVVTTRHGPELWDDLLDRAGLDGAYTALGNYDDAELEALIACVAAAENRSRADVLRSYGRAAIPLLAERYPRFFRPGTTVEFVTTLNTVIHSEVRKLYPGAAPPELAFSDVTDRSVTVGYRSRRRMSALAVGFIEGAADHYGEQVSIERVPSTPSDSVDAEACMLRCRFGPRVGG